MAQGLIYMKSPWIQALNQPCSTHLACRANSVNIPGLNQRNVNLNQGCQTQPVGLYDLASGSLDLPHALHGACSSLAPAHCTQNRGWVWDVYCIQHPCCTDYACWLWDWSSSGCASVSMQGQFNGPLCCVWPVQPACHVQHVPASWLTLHPCGLNLALNAAWGPRCRLSVVPHWIGPMHWLTCTQMAWGQIWTGPRATT